MSKSVFNNLKPINENIIQKQMTLIIGLLYPGLSSPDLYLPLHPQKGWPTAPEKADFPAG